MTGDDPDRTIYSPGAGLPPAGTPPTGTPSSPPANPDVSALPLPPQASTPPAPSTPPSYSQSSSSPVPSPLPQSGAQAIKVGDVLNHMFEVTRHIARGGMGEVFEGANVNFLEERVAIKVILPHLAADAAVQGMFYKEARTLTRLTHPALVQYRTMAQEPQLGVFYIVTEFVDGPNLSDRLKDIEASPKQIASLTKRLAEGLAVAHKMGAIHRDISPDNILLEGGTVDGAKIIDFGIAKDLDPTAATIVGDGFAGKLNYVAPEQLGEYARDIGPWTDVYSLGLTILAVARRRDVDMGGTIVDAVDKRRAGPDLSPVPDGLRPLIEKMVAANPQNRFRSMDEVVQWINDWSQGKAAPPAKPAKAKKEPKAKPADTGPGMGAKAAEKVGAGIAGVKGAFGKAHLPAFIKEPRGMAIVGGGALGLLVLVGVVLSFTGGSSDKGANGAAAGGNAGASVADPVATARSALGGGLAKVPCSWLDIEAVDGGNGSPVAVSLKGVSGQSSQAIAQIEAMLKAAGVGAVSVNYADIAPVPATFCGQLEAFGQFRASGAQHISMPQTKFEMAPLDANFGKSAGQIAAKAIIDINLSGTQPDVAVVGIDEAGQMQLLSTGLKDLPKDLLEDMGNQHYRLNLPTTSKGWSGIILINGKPPFATSLFNHAAGTVGADWPQKFVTVAKAQGWKTEMVWYQSVNDQPDTAPGPAGPPAPSQAAAPQR